MAETVLITGAFGLIGFEAVQRFAADGWQVVATAHRNTAKVLPPGVEIQQVDLTDPAQVNRVVSEVAPTAIIHLAAVIPPQVYRDAKIARRINVGATAALVRAAEAQPNPPRFVQASSLSVYGSRNPHRQMDKIGPDTEPRPSDLYGGHKLEAEKLVRSSRLDWVVLRLGGVISTDPSAHPFSSDAVFFSSALPTDVRMHTVDVRDVATAFAAATTADVVGEILLIAGDDSHLLRQGQIGADIVAASGMPDLLPQGRPGDPDSDDWFPNDWADVTRAQQLLSFQHYSWPDMLGEIRAHTGWKRYPMRLALPVARAMLRRQAAYRKAPGTYADPWTAVRARFGEPGLDTAQP